MVLESTAGEICVRNVLIFIIFFFQFTPKQPSHDKWGNAWLKCLNILMLQGRKNKYTSVKDEWTKVSLNIFILILWGQGEFHKPLFVSKFIRTLRPIFTPFCILKDQKENCKELYHIYYHKNMYSAFDEHLLPVFTCSAVHANTLHICSKVKYVAAISSITWSKDSNDRPGVDLYGCAISLRNCLESFTA